MPLDMTKVEGQSEAVPVPFRYDVKPVASKRTIIYRPNAVQGEPRAATLGAIWAGKYDKLPSSKLIDVVWEAQSKRAMHRNNADTFFCSKGAAMPVPAHLFALLCLCYLQTSNVCSSWEGSNSSHMYIILHICRYFHFSIYNDNMHLK